MNTHESINASAAKIVGVALGLLLAFMMVSNLLSWKANVTASGNLRASVLGGEIQDAYQNLGEDDSSNFSLAQDAVSTRLVVPEKAQAYLTLPRSPDLVATGNIDEGSRTDNGWKLRGWTNVPESAGAPKFVIAVEDEKVIGVLPVDVDRPDVARALKAPSALRTGYAGQVTRPLEAEGCKVTLYTLTSSLKLYSMPSLCDNVTHLSL